MEEDHRMRVIIKGHGLYDELDMSVVPRKGERLNMGSLTRGRVEGDPLFIVQVSNIEWVMDQMSGDVHPWLTVRRVNFNLETAPVEAP
jgi:hypothetical protein